MIVMIVVTLLIIGMIVIVIVIVILRLFQKGTNGVSTNGVTAFVICF